QNLAENIPFFLNKTVNNSAALCSGARCTTNNILAQNPNGAIGANAVNHNFSVEYNEVWNLTLQTPVTSNTSVQVEYVGSRTGHADSSAAVNLPSPGSGNIQARRPNSNLNSFVTL